MCKKFSDLKFGLQKNTCATKKYLKFCFVQRFRPVLEIRTLKFGLWNNMPIILWKLPEGWTNRFNIEFVSELRDVSIDFACDSSASSFYCQCGARHPLSPVIRLGFGNPRKKERKCAAGFKTEVLKE